MRGSTLNIGQAIGLFLRESGLEKTVLETRVTALWPQVMGATVARLTRSVEVADGVLIVRISSAALKAQLFDCRFELVKKINEAVGGEVIHDCRILG
jgi:predicted nucleic acid-binding Zn ribbon protein